MKKDVFFDGIRALTGPLSMVQVKVAEAIIDRAQSLSAQHLAYILATAWGEAKLTPKRENMNYSAKRIREVWPKRPEAVQFAGKPKALANSVYGGRLGNKLGTDDGWRFRGGGVDQLTGRDNYRRIGIEARPEAILEPAFAAWSIVHGMTTGRYTGRKLADYGDGATFSPRNARAIVNGDVKLNGAKYAAHYRVFLVALQEAGWQAATTPEPPNPEPPKPAAIEAPPKPAPQPPSPAPVAQSPAPRFSIWAVIWAGLRAILTRGSVK